MKTTRSRAYVTGTRKSELEPEDREWTPLGRNYTYAQIRGKEIYSVVLDVNGHECRLERTFRTPKQALDYVKFLQGEGEDK